MISDPVSVNCVGFILRSLVLLKSQVVHIHTGRFQNTHLLMPFREHLLTGLCHFLFFFFLFFVLLVTLIDSPSFSLPHSLSIILSLLPFYLSLLPQPQKDKLTPAVLMSSRRVEEDKLLVGFTRVPACLHVCVCVQVCVCVC